MLRPFYLLVYRIFGWKIVGKMPDLEKYVVALAPHTSNWDFVVGVCARSILRMNKAKFLGKSQLFKPGIGWFFRALGGYPVYRDKHTDMVEQVASAIRSSDSFILAIAPEGTRKKVDKLKTGFYYIAKSAGVPIVPVGLDYKKKEVIIADPIYPADFDKDMEHLMLFYKGITGKNPELGLS